MTTPRKRTPHPSLLSPKSAESILSGDILPKEASTADFIRNLGMLYEQSKTVRFQSPCDAINAAALAELLHLRVLEGRDRS